MLHISFRDGSNYIFRGTDAEIKDELRKWSKDFRLFGKFRSRVGGILFINAEPKKRRVIFD